MRAETRSAAMAALACAAVAAVVVGVIRGNDAEPPVEGLRMTYSMDLDATTDRDKAIDTAVAVVRDRVESRAGDRDVAVRRRGEAVEVDLVGLSDEELAGLADVIARVAALRFVIVDDGNPWMARLAEGGRAGTDVTADADGWAGPDGKPHNDLYLRAFDRQADISLAEARTIGCLSGVGDDDGMVRCMISGMRAIERYATEAAQRDPAFALPPDRRLGYEYVEATGMSDRPYWRSYLLDRTRMLDGRIVEGARLVWGDANRPEVQVELTPTAARAFEDLTAANVGRKIAIELDGRIKSAPVINGPIPGGKVNITMGGSDAEAQERDAQELVTVLRTGSLPAAMRHETTEEFKTSPAGGFLARSWMFFALATVLVAAFSFVLVRGRRKR